MNQNPANKQDIPAPLAVALLMVVVGFLFLAKVDIKSTLKAWNDLIELNQLVVGLTALAFTLNAGSLVIWIMRLIGKKESTKHLKKLAGIRGQKLTLSMNLRHVMAGSFVAGAVLVLAPSFKTSYAVTKVIDRQTIELIDLAARINVAVACSLLCVMALRLRVYVLGKKKVCKGFADFPKSTNVLTLGSTDEGAGDDSTEMQPQWVSIGKRGLNGNLLITGSIGSGKTQGAILPYLEQLLTRLSPKPSVLAIDPKGTFVKEARPIIEKAGLSDQCIAIGEDSATTFNPIYLPEALIGGKYLQIAQMIRAASANFSKSGADDPFWDISAFNLTKNALVYCAAIKDYYTLKDLYDVVIKAHDKSTCQTLIEALATKKFSDEARYNIERAVTYFLQEFGQLDTKVRTSILASTTNFLNVFQDYRASQMFCPPADGLTLKSMDEVIDQGKILLFEVANQGLARAMGTFVKLHYQQSLLNRITSPIRDKNIPGVLIIDEYQDVATVGDGTVLGDDRFFAKSREANTIGIVATQSLTSLESAIGREKSARELIQNFRTRIACQSMDLTTTKLFQELVGQEDRERISHGFSESSPDARGNVFTGQMESQRVNLGQSINKAVQKEYVIAAKDFSRLKTFEALALVFDGVSTTYKRLFLKPHFLVNKATAHAEVIERLSDQEATSSGTVKAVVTTSLVALAMIGSPAHAWPGVCDAVKSPDFESCLDLEISSCTCGYPQHPCALISYYAPETFVEVVPNAGESEFSGMPGTASQLKGLSSAQAPFGARGEVDSHSFHAHVLTVPEVSLFTGVMPCSSSVTEKSCFEAMSEHLGQSWATGSPDLSQPAFLAWSQAPKACLLSGAALSAIGGEATFAAEAPICSSPRTIAGRYPPSSHSVCNGWGIFFPRCGTYDGTSQVGASLMIGARMKSLASEVFMSTPSSPDEKWQMVRPQSSGCFREGQNLGILETFGRATEVGRLGNPGNERFLYTIWRKTSCCQEYSSVATTRAALAGIKASCQMRVR